MDQGTVAKDTEVGGGPRVRVFSSYLKGFSNLAAESAFDWFKRIWLIHVLYSNFCYFYGIQCQESPTEEGACQPWFFCCPVGMCFANIALVPACWTWKLKRYFWTASEELLSEHTSQEIVSKHLEEKEHYQKHIKHTMLLLKTCNNTWLNIWNKNLEPCDFHRFPISVRWYFEGEKMLDLRWGHLCGTDEPSSSEPIGNLHGESMVGNLWLKFSKNIGTNIARIWIILDHVSHRSLFLFVVCVFSVYSRGRGWMREWMTRSKLQVKVLSTSQNLIHLSSSHQAFPDENCPNQKVKQIFKIHFPDFLGFFGLGGPEVFFQVFSQRGTSRTPSESEVQRGRAHSEGGTRSYRKDAAPRGVWGMGKSTPSL